MIPISLLIFFFTILVIYVVKVLTKNYDYFEKRGIKYFKPYLLIGTNVWVLKRKAIAYDMLEKCEHFKDEKVFGIFDFTKPVTVVKDPELIKRITVKDFEHFTDHRTPFNPKSSKIVENLLVTLQGKKWYEVRTSLTPIFTSSKMRLMFELISNCGQQLVNNLKADASNRMGSKSYEMKDICSKYSCDVIASCAFGYQSDSYRDPDNQFYDLGKSLLALRTPKMILKLLTLRFSPTIAKLLKMSIFHPKASAAFYKLIVDTMKEREEKQISRPDLINSLVQMRKGTLTNDDDSKVVDGKKSWNNDELVAQCYTFFFAGFDTVSTLLLFATYELAVNPDVQNRLRDEINMVQEQLGEGKAVTYEAIQGMKYMDMVVSEVLRKWPPGPVTDRVCSKAYQYESEGVKLKVNVGDVIWIPVYAIHHCDEYYPDPEKFDPERFSEENKNRINPNTYLSFGIGPRNCIGSRFALLEIKTLLFYLLSTFKLDVAEGTEVPIRLKAAAFGLVPHKPIFVNLKFLDK